MRIERIKKNECAAQPQHAYQARIKAKVFTTDLFVQNVRRVTRTVHGSDMPFDDYDREVAAGAARDHQVASRSGSVTSEVWVNPEVRLEHAVLTLGRFTLFVLDEKIKFEPRMPIVASTHTEPLPMVPQAQPAFQEII